MRGRRRIRRRSREGGGVGRSANAARKSACATELRHGIYWLPQSGGRIKRNLYIGGVLVALIIALGVGSALLQVHAAGGNQAPRFEVDPMWPKPLPNHWVMGNVIGVSVDAKDHIWIIHRQGSLEAMENYAATNPPGPKRRAGVVEAECCSPAPPVLEFDEAGNLLASWGGQDGDGYVWPASNHGITVDYKGNVWIGGNGRTKTDANAPAAGRGRGAAVPGQAPPEEQA